MNLRWTGRLFAVVVIALSSQVPGWSQERFDLGVRGVLSVADGEPANDIPGFGVFGHYRLKDRWSLGLALDRTEYDFEQPARLLGLAQDPALPPIDVVAEATVVSAWLQRDFGRDASPTQWFWGLSLGLASIDVPDAAGPLVGSGGSFDIRTDAGTEVVASALAGWSRRLGRRWFVEFAVRADQHFADWQLTDRVSGARATVDDYLALGGHLGLGYKL